jgi:hypothetical protein
VCRRSGSTMGLDSSGRSDGERGMAGANALGQRGSNVWPTICSRLSEPRTEMLSMDEPTLNPREVGKPEVVIFEWWE